MSFIIDASALSLASPGPIHPCFSRFTCQGRARGNYRSRSLASRSLQQAGSQPADCKTNASDLQDALDLIQRLPIQVVPIDPDPDHLLTLMNRYRLTAYDAAYLQLAIDARLSLATYDSDLITAAPLAGVILLS